jgi:hypothetical protein
VFANAEAFHLADKLANRTLTYQRSVPKETEDLSQWKRLLSRFHWNHLPEWRSV